MQFGWLENKKTRTADTSKISWWFVIHADEAVLCELDSKWELAVVDKLEEHESDLQKPTSSNTITSSMTPKMGTRSILRTTMPPFL